MNLKDKSIAVSKVPFNVCEASKVDVVLVNAPKHLALTTDIVNRISKLYSNRMFCSGSKIFFPYFGIKLTGDIRKIEAENKNNSDVIESFEKLSLRGSNFYKTSSRTVWNVFK